MLRAGGRREGDTLRRNVARYRCLPHACWARAPRRVEDSVRRRRRATECRSTPPQNVLSPSWCVIAVKRRLLPRDWLRFAGRGALKANTNTRGDACWLECKLEWCCAFHESNYTIIYYSRLTTVPTPVGGERLNFNQDSIYVHIYSFYPLFVKRGQYYTYWSIEFVPSRRFSRRRQTRRRVEYYIIYYYILGTSPSVGITTSMHIMHILLSVIEYLLLNHACSRGWISLLVPLWVLHLRRFVIDGLCIYTTVGLDSWRLDFSLSFLKWRYRYLSVLSCCEYSVCFSLRVGIFCFKCLDVHTVVSTATKTSRIQKQIYSQRYTKSMS